MTSADVSLALRLEIAGPLGVLLGSLIAGRLSTRALSLLFAVIPLVPAITVFLVLVNHLRGRRWKEAVVAVSVLVITAFSAVVGKK